MSCINFQRSQLNSKDRKHFLPRATTETSTRRSYTRLDPNQGETFQDANSISTTDNEEWKNYDNQLNTMLDGEAIIERPQSSFTDSDKQHRLSKTKSFPLLKRSSRVSRTQNYPPLPRSPPPPPLTSCTSRFQRELQVVQRNWHYKQHQELGEQEKVGTQANSLGLKEAKPDYYQPTNKIANHSPTSVLDMLLQDGSIQRDESTLEEKLQKTRRMLDLERVKNLALKDRMNELDSLLRSAKKSQSNKLFDQHTRQIRHLQEEVTHFRELMQYERGKRNDIQDKYETLRRKYNHQREYINILVFQHIPNVAPKFKDIGPVNYNITESFDTVGPYSIGDELGQGHYGSVRIAGCEGRKYAVKILRKSKFESFKDVQQVAIEAHILRSYRHPGIIHLEDIFHCAENIYFVTELCSKDLLKYHDEVGLTEESAKQIIFGVLRPLQHLHSHGICHLDLKPENILLTQTLRAHNVHHTHVRLCDFGLANVAPKPNTSKDIFRKDYCCGTPGFYAPEMVLQTEFEGRRADIWSLGCIILEITLGLPEEWTEAYDMAEEDETAFRNYLEKTLRSITTHKFPMYTELVSVLHDCLSIDPSKRICAAQALDHPWLENVAPEKTTLNGFNGGQITAMQWARVYVERSNMLSSDGLCQPLDI